ncbi:MAG TPA: DUF481 domain-containing protein [Bryobacteraceae bacterium]|nr:DUF481 domain-containing protein [Bryobacteraceae bacterium]
MEPNQSLSPRSAVLIAACVAATSLYGQAKSEPKAEPDVLIFTDGEKLIGHLVRSTGDKVTFKSDMAGEVTVEWKQIQELHSSQKYAVIRKGVQLRKHETDGKILQGTLAVADQKIEIRPAGDQPPQTVAVGDAGYIVDEAAFEKVMHRPGIFEAWKGAVTGGVSLVEATQKSNTFSGRIGLVRAVPTEDWLDPRNRTIVDFSTSYGKLTQPNTPTVKTSIYHADGERDEYFSGRVFGFGQLAYDHNFSQGLDLQQTYGGGIGWTVIKTPYQTLDLKGSMSYVKQQFTASAKNQNLVGSIFAEAYNRTLPHGILLSQQLSATPAWNNTSAYSAVAGAGLTMPVFKRLSLALNALDTFLNDPPAGFKKNSFQFTTGVTYTVH